MTGTDSSKVAKFRPSTDIKSLLHRLNQLPEVRANVVADAAARLQSGELDSEAIARAILRMPRE